MQLLLTKAIARNTKPIIRSLPSQRRPKDWPIHPRHTKARPLGARHIVLLRRSRYLRPSNSAKHLHCHRVLDYYVTLMEDEVGSDGEELPAKKVKASELTESPARYLWQDAKDMITVSLAVHSSMHSSVSKRQPSATTSARGNKEKEEEIGLLRKPTRTTKPFHNLRRLRQELDERKPGP